jgi:hypothetical protein
MFCNDGWKDSAFNKKIKNYEDKLFQQIQNFLDSILRCEFASLSLIKSEEVVEKSNSTIKLGGTKCEKHRKSIANWSLQDKNRHAGIILNWEQTSIPTLLKRFLFIRISLNFSIKYEQEQITLYESTFVQSMETIQQVKNPTFAGRFSSDNISTMIRRIEVQIYF